MIETLCPESEQLFKKFQKMKMNELKAKQNNEEVKGSDEFSKYYAEANSIRTKLGYEKLNYASEDIFIKGETKGEEGQFDIDEEIKRVVEQATFKNDSTLKVCKDVFSHSSKKPDSNLMLILQLLKKTLNDEDKQEKTFEAFCNLDAETEFISQLTTVLQNGKHTKNSDRSEAIQNGSYIDVYNIAVANKYLRIELDHLL